MKTRTKLPSAVVALGVVAFLNDAASEMIFPLLPAFVATLGGGPSALGLIEGVAEATASATKLVAGSLADRIGRLRGLTIAGYALANILRPLLALAQTWTQVLVVRFGDRIGKGIRTPPRDALLAAAAPPEMRGRAFGFHRAMDHAGAFVGPAVAALLLYAGMPLRHVFAWTVVPGALALAVLVTRVRTAPVVAPARVPGPVFGLPPAPAFRRLLLAVTVFALGNSSDAFLLWRARELGLPAAAMPLAWIVLHVVKSTTSTWGGALSDRRGRRTPILAGWAIYAVVYAGLAVAKLPWHAWALFAAYGVFFGLTEGAEKAFIVDLVEPAWRGRALGAYHAAVGAAALPASLMFGLLYDRVGPAAAFGTGAALAGVAALLLPRSGPQLGDRGPDSAA